jgi:NADH-quinone oxidoreductase subunit M
VRPQMRQVADLRGSEMWAASVLTAGILLLGIFPAPALRLSQATLAALSAGF